MSEILIYQEAEEFIRDLQSFDIHNIGSKEWHTQHTRLVKLNMQSHQNLLFNREEYIAELMNTYKKWDVIICDTISIHLFKVRIFPLIFKDLAERHKIEPIRPDLEPCINQFLYTILFHEVVLAEFLASACLDKLPDAAHLDDLAEWCMHHIANMIMKKYTMLDEQSNKADSKSVRFDPRFPTSEIDLQIAQKLRARLQDRREATGTEHIVHTELAQHIEDNIPSLFNQLIESDTIINYNVSLTVLSLLRGLLFHKIPMPVQLKLQSTRLSVLVAQLLTKDVMARYGNVAPWQRMCKDNKLEYWDGASWCRYTTNEEATYKLTMVEAQVWLILIEAQANIPDQFTQNELSIFESIKGRINEALTDQLPELKRYRLFLEQLILQGAQQNANSALAKQQQKIRDQYGIADDFATASDMYLYSPGSILVQTTNFYESELILKLRYWYNTRTKSKSDTLSTNSTFITDVTGTEVEGTSVQSIAAISRIVKNAMYTTLAEAYVELMGGLRIDDIANSSSTGVYLDHYSSVFPVCANCNLIARNRCSRCHKVWYCGRKCQKIDWVAKHSKVCKKESSTQKEQTVLEPSVIKASTPEAKDKEGSFDSPD